jgi:hypothetical protein
MLILFTPNDALLFQQNILNKNLVKFESFVSKANQMQYGKFAFEPAAGQFSELVPQCSQSLWTALASHYHPLLCHVAERITQNCDGCQHQKLPGPQYVHLPPCKAALLPWEEVALDLIGP